MSVVEFDAWQRFYEQHPFDDLHRYHRPAALVSASMGDGDIKKRLEFLAPDVAEADKYDGWSDADIATFKALGVVPPKKE